METINTDRAEEYYALVGEKNLEGIKKLLHPDAECSGPLSILKGREALLGAVGGFMQAFESLKVRSVFGKEDQAVVIYELDMPGIAKSFRSASLLTFKDGLIVKMELFFDGTPFRERS